VQARQLHQARGCQEEAQQVCLGLQGLLEEQGKDRLPLDSWRGSLVHRLEVSLTVCVRQQIDDKGKLLLVCFVCGELVRVQGGGRKGDLCGAVP
jgi:hypothetical protein